MLCKRVKQNESIILLTYKLYLVLNQQYFLLRKTFLFGVIQFVSFAELFLKQQSV